MCCILLLSGLVSCGAGEILNIPQKKAEEQLVKGDISFILAADVARLEELESLRSPAFFYAGLLAGETSPPHAAALFRLALNDPSPLIRDEAAQKLIPLVLADNALAERLEKFLQRQRASAAEPDAQTAALECAVSFALGRFEELSAAGAENASRWERILRLAGFLAGKAAASESPGFDAAERTADLLFRSPIGEIDRWAMGRDGVSPLAGFSEFGEAEYAALAGRLAVARSAYEAGLAYFRTAMKLKRSLFFRYPELLGDLGRAFQFGAALNEGLTLFTEWDQLFRDGAGDIPAKDQGPIRYRLLYFAGRMERQRGQFTRGAELFTRALAFAPDAAQEDACIWYILDAGLAQSTRTARAQNAFGGDMRSLLQRYIPQWHDPYYFEDILDRLAQALIAGRQWGSLLEVFSLLPQDDGKKITAQYAYVLGRALEEGFFSEADAAKVLAKREGASSNQGGVDRFFAIARDQGAGAYYYRALASSRLGSKLVPDAPRPDEAKEFDHPEIMEFLLGFFRFGAGRFAYGYIRHVTRELSPAELRALAKALYDNTRWAEAMRLVTGYMNREGYVITRADMEIYYPRPFQDLVEFSAKETGIHPALLYGLIHTESAFEADIRSRAGALGLTQLMPATAREMAGRLRRQGGPDYAAEGDVDLSNPQANIQLGAYYLRYLMNHLENPLLAILAYNGGMGRVRRWRAAESRLPADIFPETVELTETREYGRKVLSAAAAYGYLYYDMTMEAVLADIWRRQAN